MPVKRRLAKRRLDPEAEVEAWESAFDSEFDFFGDLESIGVPTDDYGRPDAVTAEAAWHRLGRIFLDRRNPDPHRAPWALVTFGEPT